MTEKTSYTVGFFTDRDRETFLMVRKGTGENVMEFMRGKWNGIGGKALPGEFMNECMAREFFEETGMTGNVS